MSRRLTPIPPLSIPRAEAPGVLDEAEVCAEAPIAPGLDPHRCFPGVKAWRVTEPLTTGHRIVDDIPVAYVLFVPVEYIEPGMDEEHRSGRGSIVTQAVGSPLLDVRDVEADDPFTIARAVRRALAE